jgi:hypothetical protein
MGTMLSSEESMENSTQNASKRQPNKMSWWAYISTHLIPTWFKSFGDNFKMWRDLMTGNYANYALLDDDDPFTECYEWFWCSINLDETYPKEFLEYLQDLCDRIDSGEEELIPMDLDQLKRIEELLENVEL